MVLDSGETFWVRWYPSAPGAKPYPDWHAFGSPIWEGGDPDDFVGPGALREPLIWRGKTYPAPPGQHFRGLPEWFADGLPSALRSIDPMDDLCGQVVIDPRGGMCVGGEAIISGEVPIVNLIVEKTTQSILTSNVNVLPIGEGVAYRLTATEPVTINGLSDPINGRLICLANVGNHLISLAHQALGPDPQFRILTIDQVACRLYPGFESWLQYDGESSRWREMNTVPLVSMKADLITHTGTEPSVLRSFDPDGHVLTKKADEPTGMKWQPPAGAQGQDWFYWCPGSYGDVPVERWSVAGYGTGGLIANIDFPANTLVAMPLPRPRGGTIDRVAIQVQAVPGAGANVVMLGLYSNVGGGRLFPTSRLDMSGDLDVSSLGTVEWELDSPLTVAAGDVLWCVLLSSDGCSITAVTSEVVHSGPFPGLGFKDPTRVNPGIGWTVGFDPSGMGDNQWPYDDGLPGSFPELPGLDGTAVLEVGENAAAPAIFVHWSG